MSNAVIAQAGAIATMIAQQMEANIDRELDHLDNLNDTDLEQIRQKRMKEMARRAEKSKEWAARGHGEYLEIQTEQDFFKAMKVRACPASPRPCPESTDFRSARPQPHTDSASAVLCVFQGEDKMICHFFRENWPCKVGTQAPAQSLPVLSAHRASEPAQPCISSGLVHGSKAPGIERLSISQDWHGAVFRLWACPLCTGHGQAFKHPVQEAYGDQVCQGRPSSSLQARTGSSPLY